MRQPAPAHVKELYQMIKEVFGGEKPIVIGMPTTTTIRTGSMC
ncbi:MAG: hypothetical protein ACR2J5_12980 [Geodermatophilaceae bacterium]